MHLPKVKSLTCNGWGACDDCPKWNISAQSWKLWNLYLLYVQADRNNCCLLAPFSSHCRKGCDCIFLSSFRSCVDCCFTLHSHSLFFLFFCLPKRIKREPICELPGEMAKANTVSFLSGMLYQSSHHHDKEHVSFTCRTEKSHAFCIPAITCQKSQYIPSCYIKYY